MHKLRHLAGRFAVVLVLLTLFMPAAYAKQKGKASYYSRKANGARTSSGVRLDNDSLVCAHRTYPFGTLLLVKNLANGKEVVVKVIDRGPFRKGRVIDLSYEAARRLGMLSAGIATVEVSLYEGGPFPYRLQPYELPLPRFELPLWGDADDAAEHVGHKGWHAGWHSDWQKKREKDWHAGWRTDWQTAKEEAANDSTAARSQQQGQTKR